LFSKLSHALDAGKNIASTIKPAPLNVPKLTGLQRLSELLLLLVILVTIFTMVALFSFDSRDPSWSQTAWHGSIHNVTGMYGAYLSDGLFFLFGKLAYYVPPFVCVGIGALLLKCRNLKPVGEWDFYIIGSRILGSILLLVSSCVLADINFDDIWFYSSGGILGYVIGETLLPYLYPLGVTLTFLSTWVAGFTLLTGVSFVTIVDVVGKYALLTIAWLASQIVGNKTVHTEFADNEDSQLSPEKQNLTKVASSEPQEPSIEEDPLDVLLSDIPLESQSSVSDVQHEPKIHVSPSFSNSVTDAEMTVDDSALSSTADVIMDAREDIAPAITTEVNVQPKSEMLEEINTEVQFATDPTVDSMLQQAEEKIVSEAQSEPNFSIPQEENMAPAQQPPVQAEPQAPVQPQIQTPAQPMPQQPSVQAQAPMQPEMQMPVQAMPQKPQSDPAHSVLMEEIAQAQQNMSGAQHPFLMKQEENLPKPTTPLPTIDLLDPPPTNRVPVNMEMLRAKGRLLEQKLADYKIKARVAEIEPGPVITRFELELAPGVKVSKLTSLSKDIARSLSAIAVRVVEIIPGKPYVGLELPNPHRETVYLSEVINSESFMQAKSPLAVVLGKDIAGDAVVADLSKMPHLLVAGTTGSGKSVGVNVMIISMLYKAKPEDVRFIMIDPKMLELSIYEGIPHLLTEVVTDMKDAGNALRWCVGEMERRYKLMSALGVRNLKGFNERIKEAQDLNNPIPDPLWTPDDSMSQEPPTLEKLPNIVVIVDEFADLMMVVGKKVEELIARLAQKARAAGIHLILATQRPSVDVITGLIKANIPSRLAFTVSTRTDSRTILDQGGAESLLGMGDMLYLPTGASHPQRIHGAFVDDHEVHKVVNDWKGRGKPNYIEDILKDSQNEDTLLPGETPANDNDLDVLFDQVAAYVAESRRGSVSGGQRRFSIGFNRAARIIEQLEAHGIVSAPARNGSREILVPPPTEI